MHKKTTGKTNLALVSKNKNRWAKALKTKSNQHALRWAKKAEFVAVFLFGRATHFFFSR